MDTAKLLRGFLEVMVDGVLHVSGDSSLRPASAVTLSRHVGVDGVVLDHPAQAVAEQTCRVPFDDREADVHEPAQHGLQRHHVGRVTDPGDVPEGRRGVQAIEDLSVRGEDRKALDPVAVELIAHPAPDLLGVAFGGLLLRPGTGDGALEQCLQAEFVVRRLGKHCAVGIEEDRGDGMVGGGSGDQILDATCG